MQNNSVRPRGTKQQLTIVTALTCSRAPVILLFMIGVSVEILCRSWLVVKGLDMALSWTNFILMVVSAFTDLFDGKYARKWNVTSKFGANCDPLMDKVFFVVVFPTVTALLFLVDDVPQGVLLLLFTVLYILRDLWVVTLRSLAVGKADMKANFVGKLRTFLGFPTGMLVYCYIAFGWPWLTREVTIAVIVFGILLNVYSLIVYTKRYGFAIKDAINSEK